MTQIDYPISAIVPHAGPMSLLDRALTGDAESLVAEVDIRADGLFFDGYGVAGWVGIEFMAQAVAAWAGWQARLAGGEPKVGFLLGSRRYDCQVSHFLPGQTLRVSARRAFQADNGLGQFDCRIEIGDQLVASAALTVFEPRDAEAFLAGQADGS